MIAVKTRAVSIALACRTFEISETCYRYERLRLRGCELLQRSFSHEKIVNTNRAAAPAEWRQLLSA